jgi:transcriptional regulator with XRE-family HTH domain
MLIGEKIRKIRSLKGFSQDYMAGKLAMSQNNYSKIEIGEIKISTDMLENIAEIFDLRPEDVLSFDEKFIFNNNTFHDQSNQVGFNNTFSNKERELYEALIREKDSKIALLEKVTELLNTALKKN